MVVFFCPLVLLVKLYQIRLAFLLQIPYCFFACMGVYLYQKEQREVIKMTNEKLEMMKQYLRDNNLTSQVREFTQIGVTAEGAIEYVYDAHTMSREDFKAKYLN